ncbi:MAG: hypothetical protein HQL96_05250 [Magnetococcales bacterium]|nr:hypothetical protein [Magnetococcales bacterium]
MRFTTRSKATPATKAPPPTEQKEDPCHLFFLAGLFGQVAQQLLGEMIGLLEFILHTLGFVIQVGDGLVQLLAILPFRFALALGGGSGDQPGLGQKTVFELSANDDAGKVLIAAMDFLQLSHHPLDAFQVVAFFVRAGGIQCLLGDVACLDQDIGEPLAGMNEAVVGDLEVLPVVHLGIQKHLTQAQHLIHLLAGGVRNRQIQGKIPSIQGGDSVFQTLDHAQGAAPAQQCPGLDDHEEQCQMGCEFHVLEHGDHLSRKTNATPTRIG